jgi:prepilin-type N-terminal cleavage/methylation domain-containing protein
MRKSSGDDGFSLVEVIIAMFLLAVLSLAVLPLLIGATQLSVVNKDLAAATAFANAQLAPVRDAFPVNAVTPRTCSSLTAYAATNVAGPAGSGLLASTAIGSCPATYPGTVAVTVTVADSDGTIVSVPTRVLVGAA